MIWDNTDMFNGASLTLHLITFRLVLCIESSIYLFFETAAEGAIIVRKKHIVLHFSCRSRYDSKCYSIYININTK